MLGAKLPISTSVPGLPRVHVIAAMPSALLVIKTLQDVFSCRHPRTLLTLCTDLLSANLNAFRKTWLRFILCWWLLHLYSCIVVLLCCCSVGSRAVKQLQDLTAEGMAPLHAMSVHRAQYLENKHLLAWLSPPCLQMIAIYHFACTLTEWVINRGPWRAKVGCSSAIIQVSCLVRSRVNWSLSDK